ncbi:MAG TPA: hypothetical protein VEA59_03195 [Patescibacteria group bacterium]|nr:hypothetical protein [Patescibacteria group bacterium]
MKLDIFRELVSFIDQSAISWFEHFYARLLWVKEVEPYNCALVCLQTALFIDLCLMPGNSSGSQVAFYGINVGVVTILIARRQQLSSWAIQEMLRNTGWIQSARVGYLVALIYEIELCILQVFAGELRLKSVFHILVFFAIYCAINFLCVALPPPNPGPAPNWLDLLLKFLQIKKAPKRASAFGLFIFTFEFDSLAFRSVVPERA